jgi:DNA-directed RNA polymerase III subunit RPC4
VVGINTDASADAPIKPIKDAEAPITEAAEGASRKGKGKAKDLEITSVRKPYKGMWQEDSEPQPIQIKAEPMNSDDEDSSPTEEPAEEVGITSASNLNEENPQVSALDGAPMSKAKSKVVPEPVMQTDEDRQEWARFQANLQHIRAELGPGAEAEDVDAVGDVVMGEAGVAKEKKQSVRDNNVYLFQIPPIMPDLLPPTVKSEPLSEPSALAPPPTQQVQPSIKLEEGATAPIPKSTAASGYVGKLRVHASGRTTLDWGGTSYELNPGHKANYLQEVVQLHVVPENERVVEEDGGEATSFGRVKGKFVVVPAWGAMLG